MNGARWISIGVLVLAACDGSVERLDGGARVDDASVVLDGASALDAASVPDASSPSDASTPSDASAAAADAASPDALPLGAWQRLAPLPRARQETGVVAHDGELWVIGGFVGARVVATVEVYTPGTDRWRAAPDLPVALHHANAASARGKIYVAGYLTGVDFGAEGRVFELTPGDAAWVERAPMPQGTERGAGGTASDGERVYVAGGFRGGAAVADVSAYDPLTDRWTPLPSLPQGRDHLAAAVIDGVLYAAAGRRGQIATHVRRLDALPLPDGAAWSARAPIPTSRGGVAGAVLRGRFFVIGGEGNGATASGVFDRVEAYDPATDTWSAHAPMATPRHGTGAATLGDRIHVPGGATRQGFGATDIHEAYTP